MATSTVDGAEGTEQVDRTVLPPGPARSWLLWPRLVTRREQTMLQLRERYGNAFTIRMPLFGSAVVLSDPEEIKAVFTSPRETVNIQPNLGRILGRRSIFALEGGEHRAERKLLTPPFHGRRLKVYDEVFVEEATREIASWPEGEEFGTLDSFMQITLNAILRAVFGAVGPDQDELRRMMPAMVEFGSRLAPLPIGRGFLGRLGPWARLDRMRAEYDAVINRLVDAAQNDPALDERDDVLALMLQARYDDGRAMTRQEIADELLTLLAAGHETTATTLSWAVALLRRHPDVLDRLVAEVDAGGDELLKATILEIQRIRPVIDFAGRTVDVDHLRVGRWNLPRGHKVMVGIRLVQSDPEVFEDPERFDPNRFVGTRPDNSAWVPFGGGVRRCIGAAFADLEMQVVLRTLLQQVTLVPTGEPMEPIHSRGVANAPAKDGLAVVRRRASAA